MSRRTSLHPDQLVGEAQSPATVGSISRREFLHGSAAMTAGGLVGLAGSPRLLRGAAVDAGEIRKARIAITFDLEMSRNFPRWQDTHWDYEKGNLDERTKQYAVDSGQRVKERGGRIHYFCVGRVLEQQDVSWLEGLADAGHPVGNHTYDHVNVLATEATEVQFRFRRSPWLVAGRAPGEVIRDNIRLTTLALKQRCGIDNRGFRTPGGFAGGLAGREDIQQMLLDAGFTWVSSKYPSHANTQPMRQPTEAVYDGIERAQAEAQPFVYQNGLVEIPMSPISDIGAFRTGRWKLDWFLEAVRRAVVWVIEQRAVFDFLAHPACLGIVDPEFKTLDLICDLVDAAGERAELVDLDRIAANFARQQ